MIIREVDLQNADPVEGLYRAIQHVSEVCDKEVKARLSDSCEWQLVLSRNTLNLLHLSISRSLGADSPFSGATVIDDFIVGEVHIVSKTECPVMGRVFNIPC